VENRWPLTGVLKNVLTIDGGSRTSRQGLKTTDPKNSSGQNIRNGRSVRRKDAAEDLSREVIDAGNNGKARRQT